MKTLVLFKNNLRINDNPVLYNGSKNNTILPVFILDEHNIKKKLGSASKYWLYNALKSLNQSLNNKMLFFRGETLSIVDELIKKYDINKVVFEETFIKDDMSLQKKMESFLKKTNIKYHSYNCTLLWEPYSVLKNDGTPYKVFTPFYKRGCLGGKEPELPLGRPKEIKYLEYDNNTNISDLNLVTGYKWYSKLDDQWDISEKKAFKIFTNFLNDGIFDYKKGRDYPSKNCNSKLSPYIRFGMISVNRLWYILNDLKFDKNIEHFKSEIGWREFSYYLLYHYPKMEYKNLQTKFDNFEWENSNEKFDSWKKGKTGFPIIDAGMRELWQTGFMHNRIRMVVASFLVKNLSIDWRLGEAWFWDCLLDADYASNIAGWQWVAGTGSDAAPYFRIFNPILQGEKFDSNGEYTLKYLPELKPIPLKLLQKPWENLEKINYPDPVIDYKLSREIALSKYSAIKTYTEK
ncbi:MAG: deoxyribodipyrimidine photolyase [Candidatus Marinimicrobia bacterium]|nr:deoxyribodipyrimidine photolyase [Candidatus Neomarinimicrobiota bacterium]